MKVVSVEIKPKGPDTKPLPLLFAALHNDKGDRSKCKDLKRWLEKAYGAKGMEVWCLSPYYQMKDESVLSGYRYAVYCDGFTTLRFRVEGSTQGTRFEGVFSQSFPSEFTWRDVKAFLARFILFTKASVELVGLPDDGKIANTGVVRVLVNHGQGTWVNLLPWDRYSLQETLAICCYDGLTVGDAMSLIGDGIGHPWYLVQISSGLYPPVVCFIENEPLMTAGQRGQLRFKAVGNEIWFEKWNGRDFDRKVIQVTDSKPTLEA